MEFPFKELCHVNFTNNCNPVLQWTYLVGVLDKLVGRISSPLEFVWIKYPLCMTTLNLASLFLHPNDTVIANCRIFRFSQHYMRRENWDSTLNPFIPPCYNSGPRTNLSHISLNKKIFYLPNTFKTHETRLLIWQWIPEHKDDIPLSWYTFEINYRGLCWICHACFIKKQNCRYFSNPQTPPYLLVNGLYFFRPYAFL